MKVTAMAGGTGAGKFLRGLVRVVPAEDVTVVVNTGDDILMHGLHVSPDLDSVTYWLGDVFDRGRGWGRRGESFRATEELARFDPGAAPGRRRDALGGDGPDRRAVRRGGAALADDR
jgi:LPPG:FO 2-phospho-L-lactate transferase